MNAHDTKPRRKRQAWLILLPVGLLVLLGLGLAIPGSPLYLPKLLEPEPAVDGRTTSQLVAALGSEDKEQRERAAIDLGRMNTAGRKALPELIRVMRTDASADVRAVAADAAGKMFPANEPETAVAEYVSAVLEAFTAGLTDPDKRVRHNSAIGLLKLKAKARPAVPVLLEAIKDPENDTNMQIYLATIRQVMLRALGEAAAGTADAVPTFTAILNEKVERPSSQGGGRVQASKESIELATKYAETSVNRRIAVCGLGLAGEHARDTAPKIRELLKSPEADDRFEAKQALERMGLPAEE